MDLTFELTNGKYVANFVAESGFDIHIEKPNGLIYFYQTSVQGTNKAEIKNLKFSYYDKVIDTHCSSPTYPKYIEIRCDVNPTMAVVNFE